MKEKDIRWSTK